MKPMPDMAIPGCHVPHLCCLTAILAKTGLEDLNSDCATFLRTIVILVFLTGILLIFVDVMLVALH